MSAGWMLSRTILNTRRDVVCGIPQIILHGTVEDWNSMIPRLRQMAQYGLEEWCATLGPVLGKIADTAAGNMDREFWLSFFRYLAGSGPAELRGWIVTRFLI
ncbi:DUF4419 domain-containing protein [Rhizobium leucaenae]|uniref:DUF4419 domain-containing protein n=1 Tax=Rhizobium leucaenae TaxID=29450 RepID=UPI003CCEF917